MPLEELDLKIGTQIAYVFDYGDEWRVMLTLRERIEDAAAASPRVIEHRRSIRRWTSRRRGSRLPWSRGDRTHA